MEEDILIKEEEQHIGTLIFNRPEKKNALSPELLLKLHLALKEGVSETRYGPSSLQAGRDVPFLQVLILPQFLQISRRRWPKC